MERDRGSKMLVLVALLVGVVGLSVGFASFANNLDIKSSAEVKPLDTFKVIFSSSGTQQAEDNVVGVLSASDADIVATDAVINNEASNPTISNLKATFNRPGQSVKYSFFAHNVGEYKAFLNAVTFKNVNGQSATKVCTPKTGTDATLVQNACEGINIEISVGGNVYSTTNTDISSSIIAIDGYAPVEVTISYAADAAVADGDFDIAFGDITLLYGSQD